MDGVFTATDTVSGLLIAAALTMVAFAHKELRAARIMLALGAILMTARWSAWSLTTDAPWIARVIVGALVGGALLGGLPALWGWAKGRQIATDVASEATPAPPPPVSLDNAIGLECVRFTLPNFVLKENRETFIVQVYGPVDHAAKYPTGAGVGARLPMAGGDPIPVNKKFYGTVYRCTLRNYSNVGILQAVVTLDILWQSTIRTTESGYKSGDVIGRQFRILPALQFGPNSEDFFYLVNVDSYCVFAKAVPIIKIMRAGSDRWEDVRLLSQGDNAFGVYLDLPEAKFKALPVQSPPSQEPPPRQ